MDTHHRDTKLNVLLGQLSTDLQKYNELRYQLLVDLQFHFENLDGLNNTLIHQKKFAVEQAEENIVSQQKESQILARLNEQIQEQRKTEEELSLYEQLCYDRLKKEQEIYFLELEMKQKEKRLSELFEEIEKTRQHLIDILFDTIKECEQQTLILVHRIQEIDKEIEKCRKEAMDLEEIITSKNKEIERNRDRILNLNEKIDRLDNEIAALDEKKMELRQNRHEILEKGFSYTDQISKFNLSLLQSHDDHLMGLIHQVELIYQGMAIIEIHHADIIKELKLALAKEEKIDHNVIENEVKNIVKKLLEKHYKEFLPEEDFIYLIAGLESNPYYRKEVERLISEIIQSQILARDLESQTLARDLNSNLDAINIIEKDQASKVAEKIEAEKECDQVDQEQAKLKVEVLEASDKHKKVIEKQSALEQEKSECSDKLSEVDAVKSTCEQIVQQAEVRQATLASDKASVKELLARKRREQEAKNSTSQSSKPASANDGYIRPMGRNPAANRNEFVSNGHEEKSQDKKDQVEHGQQEAGHDLSSSEGCGLVSMSSPLDREELSNLPETTLNEIYVRSGEQLFHVNKDKKECIEVPSDPEKIKTFDDEMKPTHTVTRLTKEKLEQIPLITDYSPSENRSARVALR